eukprot:361880-Chlamydomonas_euryale.AAC.9
MSQMQSLPCPPQAKGDATELMEKSKQLKQEMADLEEKEKEVIKARDAVLVTIGNLVHDSVVVSQDEVGVRQCSAAG